ncbi:tyrosine-type recombinase/integrase [Lactonifactor sp. BIOML-A3]|uniref:tyrosine-type recombinase/integrase n=1 Tax=unclassified Lactonifactor TaxID=2636670 RepID=UPI0012B020DB|nr:MULTISPECIES: site-specific integrase [unclassified Lactonifactor]MSA01064.1 tyrosine-type recombinase/integrase [Lactonifactor sp. BIOML-A5]MSA10291.1 tyrosine-type recombinase/integrase [Lactonifactor sp. BIOML-A4]MSA13101.1 tyrosine-type recombinase/integrase [Lactonifactor sp. BIOML-A3]MSA19263.1 tyrosine-type recombinase/integrase [Lactonifactor sp. BIOML-A2]MSA38340.1 tyrosine-type recombinase/integrase [Lactonifactor sp. BIOML-A1]
MENRTLKFMFKRVLQREPVLVHDSSPIPKQKSSPILEQKINTASEDEIDVASDSKTNTSPESNEEICRFHTKKMLVSQLIDEWFHDHRFKIMESTAYEYEKCIPFVKDYFAGFYIDDITSDMVYEYIIFLKNKYSTLSSGRIYYKILQLSLKYAMNYHYTSYNPAAEIFYPRPPRAEIKPFSEDEYKLLITADGPDWVRNGIIIAFRTGMRRGEVYALKWSDINLAQKYISVQRAISSACSKTILKTTKTPAGVRRIDIDSKLVAFLTDLKQNSLNETFVFPGTAREYRVPWNVSKELKKMCEKVGIPPRDFHALRHTHASVLLAHGVHPKIVQERLGHSSCQITMDTYSHITPTIQDTAVNVMENI